MAKIGFIGAGNMATALIQGLLGGGMHPSDLIAFDVSPARMEAMRALGVALAANILEVARASEITVLAIKPKDTQALLRDLRSVDGLREVLSIVAGWSQETLMAALPNARGIARAMPNTPSLVREGVIAFGAGHTVSPERFAEIDRLFSLCGRTVVVNDELFHAVTGLSGSGPAYVYLFMEAMADAGVLQGIPRDAAYMLSAQTLVGAAKMVLETGEHPAVLKESVCSPGGTTVEAIHALEKDGFRAAVMNAVDACVKKSTSMGQ